MSSILELRGLTAAYGKSLAIAECSLSLQAGSTCALLGPNGAGKSTLLKAIAGLVPLRAGHVVFMGRDISGLPVHQRVRLGLVLQPDTRELFGGLSVRENLLLAARNGARGERKPSQRVEQALTVFPEVRTQLDRLPNRLSGGQQQMVALARTIAAEPQVLLLDEPSMGLAPVIVQRLYAALRHLRDTMQLTVLLAEQNSGMALSVSDTAAVITHGRIAVAGSAEMIRRLDLSSIYLGDEITNPQESPLDCS